MAQTFGVIKFYWRGKFYDTDKSSTVKLSGLKNNDVEANGRVLRSTEYQGGVVKAGIIPTSNMSINDFDPALGEGEIQLQTDTGLTVVISDAWVKEQPEWGQGKAAPVQFTFNTYQRVN